MIDARTSRGYAEIRIRRDYMPTIDEELNQLEKDVRQLKIEYEQYFGVDANARPPKLSGASR